VVVRRCAAREITMQTTSQTTDRMLGDIVTDDLRAAGVMERFGLDYCCGGQRSLADACQAKSIPVDQVLNALAALGPATDTDVPPAEWRELDSLTRYIVETHHRYVSNSVPAINAGLDKLAAAHGTRHPELTTIRATFRALGDELLTHMMKEEQLLFPAIDEMARRMRGLPSNGPGMFATVLHPVRMMEDDHQEAGQLAEQIRTLTGGNYDPPADGCGTYRACFAELRRFEQDLHRHVHLENNVLFPGALAAERSLD
jgi:regulator of cell morphogenesis and NO signaling